MGFNLPINAEPLPSSIAKQGDQFLDLISDGWTNERHSLYISSMEASFMEQLYGNEHHGLDRNRSHAGGANGFGVHREGVCDNLRSERNDAYADDGGISSFPENPWIRRFRPRNAGVSRKNDGVGFSVDDDESGTDMVRERVRVHGREVRSCVGEILAEVSDQNFPDEDVEIDAEPCKRRRPIDSTATPNDQTI
ncbi:hypothetical protein E2562_017756 [Oryza meyeriana var. granulata]|uniref:Uncharacterized protein n=1 Tax=Oryza meyeriana var. granulata TaxID=110450 RepID=A0A6G1BY08_9ORYZ|nr:hypothetical protein E2562_017756 [Oryza meyeriana var. granulata]KAF0892799.1 hypothetical protein E2562_017756 [Oryza meyeriana var. granulata]